MRNKNYLFILLLVLGCSVNVKSTIGVPLDVSAKDNLNVDIDVGPAISGEAQGTFLFDSICIQCPTEYAAGIFGGNQGLLPTTPSSGMLPTTPSSGSGPISSDSRIKNLLEQEGNSFISETKIRTENFRNSLEKQSIKRLKGVPQRISY